MHLHFPGRAGPILGYNKNTFGNFDTSVLDMMMTLPILSPLNYQFYLKGKNECQGMDGHAYISREAEAK